MAPVPVLRTLACRIALAAGMMSGATVAAAAALPFSATFAGESSIVEVLDPGVPIVRVQTTASGSGVLGIVGYRSTDVVNFATGVGTGTNRFIEDDGDELWGSFTVQLVPTADPATFDLIGDMVFTGGTGSFAGATGTGGFTGRGTFDSPTHALTHFDFTGRLARVPLPSTAWLLALPLALLGAGVRRPS